MSRQRINPLALTGALALAGALAATAPIEAQVTDRARPAPPPAEVKPAIVLVHGAFADASGWGDVISILQGKGYQVSAVQNPLSSYEADIETTRRLIDAQSGPTVVVGH